MISLCAEEALSTARNVESARSDGGSVLSGQPEADSMAKTSKRSLEESDYIY